MTLRRVLFGAFCVGWLSSLAGACRSIEVCPEQRCTAEPLPTAAAGDGGRADSSGGGAVAGGAGAVSGEGGAAGERSDGSAGEPGTLGPACQGNFAECDGSRLTECETDLSWSVRHCGACGELCDGICIAGGCREALLVERVQPVSMVAASAATAFAKVNDNSGDTVLKIDVATGDTETVRTSLGDDSMLTATSDRVYLLDTEEKLAVGMPLNGSEFSPEDMVKPESIGGTAQGVYYVTHAESPKDEYQLFFRPVAGTEWKKLKAYATPTAIVSSRPNAMVLVTYADDWAGDCAGVLTVWRGDEIVMTEAEHPHCKEAKVVDDGSLVLLEHDYDADSTSLWWKAPDGNVDQYPIPNMTDFWSDNLLVLRDSVWMIFDENGRGYVREFTKQGAQTRRGIWGNSNLVWVDRNYLWYGVLDGIISARFLRVKWFDL